MSESLKAVRYFRAVRNFLRVHAQKKTIYSDHAECTENTHSSYIKCKLKDSANERKGERDRRGMSSMTDSRLSWWNAKYRRWKGWIGGGKEGKQSLIKTTKCEMKLNKQRIRRFIYFKIALYSPHVSDKISAFPNLYEKRDDMINKIFDSWH